MGDGSLTTMWEICILLINISRRETIPIRIDTKIAIDGNIIGIFIKLYKTIIIV